MNTTRNTILLILLFGAAAFIGGYVLRGSSDDSGEPIVSTTPTASVTPSPTPSATPVANLKPKTYSITFTALGVSPSLITIRPGDTIRFLNETSSEVWPASNPHPSHTECPGFDAKRGLRAGEVYTLSFPTATTCTYHSHLNPSNTALQGTIIIR